MRALLLALLLTTAANAGWHEPNDPDGPSMTYDYRTGGVNLSNIPPNIEEISVSWGMKLSAISNTGYYSDLWSNDINVYRWISYQRIHSDSYLMHRLYLKEFAGFPSELFLGNVMLPGLSDWENDRTYRPGSEWPEFRHTWNHATFEGPGLDHWASDFTIVNVPEPATIFMLMIGGALLLNRRKR